MALLEVHPETGDGGLGDKHPDLAVLERFERFRFGVGRHRAVNVDRSVNGSSHECGFVVEATPHDPLARTGGEFDSPVASFVHRLASHLRPTPDAAEFGREQLAFGFNIDVDRLGDDV